MGLFDGLRRKKPTPQQFAGIVRKQIREAGCTDDFTFDADRFVLHGGNNRVINLANFYRQYCDAPRQQRKQQLQMSVMAILQDFELPTDFEDARPDIRPRIWSRSAIENIELRQRLENTDVEPGSDFSGQLVGEHLWCSIAYDLPWSVRSVNIGEVEEWGVSSYEALEVGRHNLEEITSQYARIGEGFYSFVHGDTYDASRLMLVDRIRELTVDGQHIAMVPNRDTILVTGSDDEDGIGMMASIARKSIEEPYSLVPMPLVLDGDQWIDWFPEPGHPAFSDLHFLRCWYFAGEYKEQKQLLSAVHERELEDIFVASFQAIQRDEDICSYCVWGDGIDSMLPKTDYVVFFEEERAMVASGEWDHVHSVVGHLMTEVDDSYPARYRVRQFPSHEELERIGVLEMFAN